ncbi:MULTISPECIES: indole-3-glycerol-phosphate synthase [unclassified Brevundimonas]|uniref:indole-3-glycerol-phosphate synthase n=1 Tax=unclassified Brevundimonas TaxID=2622653 RepID=UPI0025C022FE|nr:MULTISPECIES: indole-3-glycerol-phosphate synthase [unclassified Brevundimonas]
MRLRAVAFVVAGAALLAACDIEGGDPVQHALRDAAAARQAAALKTTEEEQASRPSAEAGEELARLIAARRQAVEDTRALLATTTDPALKGQLTGDLRADEGRLRALEAQQKAMAVQ